MITEKCINQNNLKDLREMNIPENLKNLTPNQMWLLEHQITAFWHGFGFSNSHGLVVPKAMTEEYKFPNERTYKYVIIKKEFINSRLDDYVSWLRNYKKSWDNGKEYDCYPQTFDDFLKCESIHESRKPILEMICLLQDFNKIGAKTI